MLVWLLSLESKWLLVYDIVTLMWSTSVQWRESARPESYLYHHHLLRHGQLVADGVTRST